MIQTGLERQWLLCQKRRIYLQLGKFTFFNEIKQHSNPTKLERATDLAWTHQTSMNLPNSYEPIELAWTYRTRCTHGSESIPAKPHPTPGRSVGGVVWPITNVWCYAHKNGSLINKRALQQCELLFRRGYNNVNINMKLLVLFAMNIIASFQIHSRYLVWVVLRDADITWILFTIHRLV